MKISEITNESILVETVKRISKQEAVDRGMFGPVWHGTNETSRQKIDQEGFKISGIDEIGFSNGFIGNNATTWAYPPPIHTFGFGVYFTPSRAVAKQYNRNSTKGLVEYYLDAPRMEEVSFASQNTMFRWWVKNGYDYPMDGQRSLGANHPLTMKLRYEATRNMTDRLKSEFDGVYFKKPMYGGVDDAQVVVFDPSRIYRIDPALSKDDEIGARVVHNQVVHYDPEFMKQHNMTVEKQPNGWTAIKRFVEGGYSPTLLLIPPPGMPGTIVDKREAPNINPRLGIDPRFHNSARYWVSVKWDKGGIQHNYIPAELDPAPPKRARPSK